MTAVGYSEQDPTAQNLFCPTCSSTAPWTWKLQWSISLCPDPMAAVLLSEHALSSWTWKNFQVSKGLNLCFSSVKLCNPWSLLAYSKMLSLLSFPITQSHKELGPFTLSPSDGESDALLALFSSSNLLLSL
jgi:hypothetical protein